jgi:hypothetical protein
MTKEQENSGSFVPGKDLLTWMNDHYDVTQNPPQIDYTYKVAVKYASGSLGDELKELSAANSSFFLKLQGTSTMLYGSKNFDLILETERSADDDVRRVSLFTPNFSSDPSSFLPEKRFTLKADMVDSSHSNNATIGKFVNSVCTTFEDSI